MITVLATNAYKAAYKVRKAATPVKTLPVSSHMLIRVHDGHLVFTPFRFEERAENALAIPARVEGNEWATCIPARPFVDWLRATKNDRPKDAENDQISMEFYPQFQTVKIRAGNTRAEFKCMSAQDFPPC